MFLLKPGVSLKKLKPQMMPVMLSASFIFEHYGVDCVITAGDDGEHMTNSKHYEGLALDIRTRDFKQTDIKLVQLQLSESLGAQYQVIFERDHFHCEFDPKS